MMKLGVISPRHSAEGLEWVRSLGLDYAEFDVNGNEIKYLTDATDSIIAAIEKTGVKIGAVGRWGRNRINADGSFSEYELGCEKELIDFCVKVGCPVYICGVNYISELSYFENITVAIGYIKTLIDYADDRVKLCTYNCSWNNYIDKPREWDIVHDHLKKLGIKYDPSHSINGKRDYLSEAVKYGKKVDHIHLKGTINIDGVHVDDPPAGLDMVNWGMVLSIFYNYGYDGMLSIEPHSATWQGELGEKGLKYTIEYFKKLLFI